MKVTLDKENRFIDENGLLDLRKSFIYSGIKAAWCYKKGTTTPEVIREMNDVDLLRMGIDTFLNDHGTPNEHLEVSVEITGIPKLMCMILNGEHQYTAGERSLRYTKVLPSEYITDLEVELYNKWLDIFVSIFENNYKDFFLKGAKNDEKLAKTNMRKIAQENARQFVSVLTPTSTSYTAPWYEWQKIATFLMEMVRSPKTELEKLAQPYAIDLVNQLIDLKVVVLTKEAIEIYPDLKDKIKDNRGWLYRNNKGIKLSMFDHNNPFTGMNKPNEFGAAINYNTEMSFSAFAQLERHRTCDLEISIPEQFKFFTPEFIKETSYEEEYSKDMLKVSETYPQGQIINVNLNASLKNIIQFVGQERACDRAQQEIENWYVNKLLPDIVEGLKNSPEYNDEYNYLKNNYLDKCRCAYPNYHCPNPCGHPRTRRPF